MKAPRFRAGKRLWLKKDDAAMRRLYPNLPTAAVAAQLGRSTSAISGRAGGLGLHKSAAYLASPAACRLRRGDQVGAQYRFPKGHVPANKGLRRPGFAAGRMRETQFKKGQAGHNWMPIGATRLCDGYVYRKIADTRRVPWTRNWKLEHLLIWEAAHGPVPAAHCVAFKNRDRLDVRLENLELITRRANMARNTVHNLPKPLADTVMLLGALKRRINRRTREEQDRRSA